MVSEKEFLNMYFGGSSRTIGYKIHGISIEEMKLYKGLTSLVNYRCEDGCKSHGVTKKGVNLCCCGYCKRNIGYLNSILYKDVPTYAKSFGENGFWSETGCILPRELRSCLCLAHNCHSDKFKLVEKNLISIIRNGSTALESYRQMYDSDISMYGIKEHLEKRLMEKL